MTRLALVNGTPRALLQCVTATRPGAPGAYGVRVPTEHMVFYASRWRRVYAVRWGARATQHYVIVDRCPVPVAIPQPQEPKP